MSAGRASRANRALMGVRDLIISGELNAGDRLHEVALSERLGLSRTPLRAALSQLSQEGLVEPIASGGYAVRRFTRDDVIDAIELRGVIEGTAVRIAAERGISETELQTLRQLVDELDIAMEGGAKHMDFDAYVELNAELHETLWGLASDVIRREAERMARLPFASPSAFLEQQSEVDAFRRSLIGAQAQHRAIVDAIASREGARAESIAREHARLARQNLEYVLDEAPALIPQVPALSLVVR